MANDRNDTDDVEGFGGQNQGNQSGKQEDRVRSGADDDVRGVADEGDDEFEDTDDLEDEDDSDDSSF